MTDNANLDSLWDKYYGPDIVSSVEDGLVNIDDPLDILIQSLDFERERHDFWVWRFCGTQFIYHFH